MPKPRRIMPRFVQKGNITVSLIWGARMARSSTNNGSIVARHAFSSRVIQFASAIRSFLLKQVPSRGECRLLTVPPYAPLLHLRAALLLTSVAIPAMGAVGPTIPTCNQISRQLYPPSSHLTHRLRHI